MKKRTLLFSLIVSISAFVNADVFIKQKTHTDQVVMMGRTIPAKDDVITQWVGENRMAKIAKDQSVIIDNTKKTINMINHKKRTYIQMTIPLVLTKYFPEQAAKMMEDTMKSMTVDVTATNETKKVGKWNTKRYV